MIKEFTMTEEQLEALLKACQPVPLIALQCGIPPSPQENANAAWKRLGVEMGFKHMTVKPIGGDQKKFTAEEVDCRGIELEPEIYSGCTQTGGDCPVCGK